MLGKREGLVSPEVLEMFKVAIAVDRVDLNGTSGKPCEVRAGAHTSGQFQRHLQGLPTPAASQHPSILYTTGHSVNRRPGSQTEAARVLSTQAHSPR